MREFLIAVIGVVVISLVVEVVFPTKKMKGAVAISFSLAVVFILVGGIKNVFKDEEIAFPNLDNFLTSDSFNGVALEETEKQLKVYLTQAGFSVDEVELISSSNENTLEFSGVRVVVEGETDEEKLKDRVREIIEVERENIWVLN